MDRETFAAEIRDKFSDGPAAHWQMPSPHYLQLWWQEGYAEVIERETEYLLRYNICDRLQPGDPAIRFHRNDRLRKIGDWRRLYPDNEVAWFVSGLLKGFVENRSTYTFQDDPVFGLLENTRDLAEESYWDGTLVLDLFDRHEATVSVMSTMAGATDIHRAWFQEFLQRQTELRPQLDERILAYYREYDEAAGCGLDLHTVADLPRHIDPYWLSLELHNEYDREDFQVKAKLSWHAHWDDEHGVEALLHDFKIEEVGTL